MMPFNKHNLTFCLLLVSLTAWAAFEYSDYLSALCTRESGCNPRSQNQAGFLGNYQMGEAALADAGYYTRDNTPGINDWRGTWSGKNGINSQADFFASPEKQAQAINDYNAVQWRYIQADGSDRYLGQTINGILITESGLLAGAHLVGHAGLHKFLASNGQIVPHDGNKVAVTNYIAKFSGYNIAPVTGNVTVAGLGHSNTRTGHTGADSNQLNYINPNGVSTAGFEGNSIDPLLAFAAGAGLSYSELNNTIQRVISMLLFLWSAYVAWGQFRLWSEGTLSLYVMQSNILKAAALMMFLQYIVLS